MNDAEWVDRSEYPFSARYLSLPMGRMHYVDEGQGHTLLMVHGTPEWSFGYRHLIKGLSSGFRCIACDHIGFGLSDKPADWSYTPEAHAQNLAALIEHLELRDFTLVVHDYGGPIGLSYALDHPQNVRSLVIMNTWMWSLKGDAHFDGTRMLAGRVGKFLYERLSFSARVILPAAMGNKSRLTRSIHQQYLQAWKTPQERRGTWVLARELIGSSAWYDRLWQQRERIRELPALILWGMKDFAFRPSELETWKSVFWSLRVQVFEETGHFVTEELGMSLCPTIRDFLEQSRVETEIKPTLREN